MIQPKDLVLWAIGSIAAAALVHAHTAAPVTRGGIVAVAPDSPALFVKMAALSGRTEVQLAKMALDKSQDANIRQFAERMVEDHGKANYELKEIARDKHLALPRTLDLAHQQMVRELAGKFGSVFDAAYAQHMAADHSQAVALFKSAVNLSDDDLARFATKMLPLLEDHQRLVDLLPAGTASAPSQHK